MLVPGLPPGKVHAHEVVLLDDRLLNCTVSGAQPVVLVAEKPADGGVTMVTVLVAVLVPQLLVDVKTTVYTPSVA